MCLLDIWTSLIKCLEKDSFYQEKKHVTFLTGSQAMMMMLFQGPYFKLQDFIVEELHKGYLKELEEFDYVIAIGNLRELKDE